VAAPLSKQFKSHLKPSGMGDFAVKYINQTGERENFMQHLINDIRALDILLAEDLFEKGAKRIGAEQELSLVDPIGNPACKGPDILKTMDDVRVTNEIGQFNLEINLDPFDIGPNCLNLMERQLRDELAYVNQKAANFNSQVILTGILPTLQSKHLTFDNITPEKRYIALSQRLKELRGKDFEIYIQATDELQTKLDSVLFEACNTSFQLHLQVDAKDFVDQYNWAQHTAAPILAISANSPLLLQKELWMETRIALFQQSIDTRTAYNTTRYRQPRVSLGKDWIYRSPAEIFKEQVARFPILIIKDIQEEALEVIKQGGCPKLKALRTHNGTVYSWNRACYGISDNGQPHLRIETRYLPSGPSVIDEMANFAFWLGLQQMGYEHGKGLNKRISFKEARENFQKAAKSGIHTELIWDGRYRRVCELTHNELLPMAKKGLESINIDDKDINRYLGVIDKRVMKCTTGASWQVRNYRKLLERWSAPIAIQELTKAMLERQEDDIPVHEWPEVKSAPVVSLAHRLTKAGQWMTTDVFTVHESDPLSLVRAVMEWKNIRHIPVEDERGMLVGLITKSNWESISEKNEDWHSITVKQIMVTDLVLGQEDMLLDEIAALMKDKEIGCVPIVRGGQLLGIITDTDMKNLEYKV
jgi:predicted transcriptional regulator